MIKVVIIGAGGVACSLIEGVMASEELRLECVVARREQVAEEIREQFGVHTTTSFKDLPPSDIILLAVSDDAIEQLSCFLTPPPDTVVAHTAGSVALDAINQSIENRGVLYPLQNFSRGYSVDWSEIPIFIEGSTPRAVKLIEDVATALSRSVYHLNSQSRSRLHLAAVFGCNFTNMLLGLAAEELSNIDIPFSALTPLIEQTLRKAIDSSSPHSVQTGPAVRGDVATQQSHLDMINDRDKEDIYRLISSMIWKISKRN